MNTEFWNTKFIEVKTLWGMNPSDSAILAKDIFKNEGINNILIPGVGYGRNANIFIQNGIKVTGIEISDYAIEMARHEYKLNFPIHHGSVNDMPFDNSKFDGIFCYSLIHLLNNIERRQFIQNCYNQLLINGIMIFVMVSKKASMYGKGRLLSANRYKIMKGLNVFFYDLKSAEKEFKDFGLFEIIEFDEPIKHMENEPPLKCILVKCKKNNN